MTEKDLPVQDNFEKLEKKLKLSNVLTGKKFSDLDLRLDKLDENLKKISTDFPKIKERSGRIEDLLNVINLGIESYENNFDDLNARFTKLEKIPEDVKASVSKHEKKVKTLEDNLIKISNKFESFNILKEDISNTILEEILPKIQALSENSKENKTDIENIKKDLNTLSSTLKSFEKIVESANLDAVVKRFDYMEDQIKEALIQIEGFKKTLSIITENSNTENLKQKLKETGSMLDKLNELETKINILQKKFDDLNLFDASKKSELKGREDIVLQNQIRIDELTKRLDALSNILKRKIKEVKNMKSMQTGETGEVAKLDMVEIGEAYKKMEEMYNDMLKRMSDLKGLGNEVKGIELPPILNQAISKLEERSTTLDNNYNDIVKIIEDLVKSVKETQNAMTSWNKNVSDYRKHLEKRINVIEQKGMVVEVPKDLVDELSSLKEMMNQLSAENKEFKKMVRDMRINQMTTVEPETVADLANKVNLLGKKIVELDEETSKSVQELKKLEELEKLKKEVADKTKQIEIEMKEIERKVKEEFAVRPVILE